MEEPAFRKHLRALIEAIADEESENLLNGKKEQDDKFEREKEKMKPLISLTRKLLNEYPFLPNIEVSIADQGHMITIETIEGRFYSHTYTFDASYNYPFYTCDFTETNSLGSSKSKKDYELSFEQVAEKISVIFGKKAGLMKARNELKNRKA